jgi:hypothetical protein
VDGGVSHEYNWFDGVRSNTVSNNVCPPFSAFPCILKNYSLIR